MNWHVLGGKPRCSDGIGAIDECTRRFGRIARPCSRRLYSLIMQGQRAWRSVRNINHNGPRIQRNRRSFINRNPIRKRAAPHGSDPAVEKSQRLRHGSAIRIRRMCSDRTRRVCAPRPIRRFAAPGKPAARPGPASDWGSRLQPSSPPDWSHRPNQACRPIGPPLRSSPSSQPSAPSQPSSPPSKAHRSIGTAAPAESAFPIKRAPSGRSTEAAPLA